MKKTVSEQRKQQYELLRAKLAVFWTSNKGLNPKIMVYCAIGRMYVKTVRLGFSMTCTFKAKLEYPSKTPGTEVVNDRTVQIPWYLCRSNLS